MSRPANPALSNFAAEIRNQLLVAQVLITRVEQGYELRHCDDRETAPEALQTVSMNDLRKLVETTESGMFRPLKSAPTLRSGWLALAAEETELGRALEQLYPGAIPDWLAARNNPPPVTHYRDFTARQTGMYRITTLLDDVQAARVIRSCCDARFCLKQRLWTVAGLATDPGDRKSIIPCLEPCAVLLEFARKAVRLEQEEPMPLELKPGEVETIHAALEIALQSPDSTAREADFSSATNRRRIQLLLEKLKEHDRADPVPNPDSQ